MKRLYDFQSFDKSFFDKLDLVVVNSKNKEDRKMITVIILEDKNIYKTGEQGLNRFEKFYINILNSNFENLNFNEGDEFKMSNLEEDYKVSIFGENFNKMISIKGHYLES